MYLGCLLRNKRWVVWLERTDTISKLASSAVWMVRRRGETMALPVSEADDQR
jgi:hypothetical protein